MTNLSPVDCTCPHWCPLHGEPTRVDDQQENALLVSLEGALATEEVVAAPWRVRAALFAGTAAAIELGRLG